MKKKLALVVLSFFIIVSIVSISFIVSSVGDITPEADAYDPINCENWCFGYAAVKSGCPGCDPDLVWILFTMCLDANCDGYN